VEGYLFMAGALMPKASAEIEQHDGVRQSDVQEKPQKKDHPNASIWKNDPWRFVKLPKLQRRKPR
jgi:hypothetical protein